MNQPGLTLVSIICLDWAELAEHASNHATLSVQTPSVFGLVSEYVNIVVASK